MSVPWMAPGCCGVQVTCSSQLCAGAIGCWRQVSVSAKLWLAVMLVTASEMLQVFVTVMVCGLLVVFCVCPEKRSAMGVSVAVVDCALELSSGICQIPRPYVEASRTFVLPEET